MRKTILAALFASAAVGQAQIAADSSNVATLGEAQVVSTRAQAATPMAFSNVGKAELRHTNFGQDIPFLLSHIPNVVITSDAGNGIGYTSIRVRGTDPTRINVTNNGIPLNDAESHMLFWVDLPDFASSVEDIQVQRGVGTSTNGAGAFGASINMRTETFAREPYIELNGSYGSFNSQKETIKFGSGLLGKHWTLEGRLSHIASHGYRDRATTDMGSYYTQIGYTNAGTLLRFVTFGGKETSYHAWDGISRELLKTNRRYNPNGEILDEADHVTGFYADQEDVFIQNHYQILLTQALNPRLMLNAALHYTYGKGWYEEYKNKRSLADYGLKPFLVEDAPVKYSDLVRRKYNRGDFGGATFSLNYKTARLVTSFGGAFNYFDNDHYGEVRWVKNYIGELLPNQRYYTNRGRKGDGNLYPRADWRVLPRLNLYGDLQWRHIHYVITGLNDDGYNMMDIHETFDFFNPKFGATWDVHRGGQAYASLAVAHKEPSRNNYTDGFLPGMKMPRTERLLDYELGYRFRSPRFEAGANIYYMTYKDQLVLTGRVNEIGEPVVENVPESYRLGLELEAAWKICDMLRWNANLAVSRNRIKNYTAYLYDLNGDWNTTEPVHIGDTPISFSPNFVFNNVFTINWKQFSARVQSQYVSRQYLDNLGTNESSLDPYFLTHINLDYNLPLKGIKNMVVGITVYNLFNAKYETNGYAQTSFVRQSDGSITLYHDPRFYPMAGINGMIHTTLRF